MNSQPQSTVIGANTYLKGNIAGEESLSVIGRIEGRIALAESLLVESTGIVVADVQVKKAVISGTLVGNVTAAEIVHVTEEGRVVGDLVAPRVVLAEGASFRGAIEMRPGMTPTAAVTADHGAAERRPKASRARATAGVGSTRATSAHTTSAAGRTPPKTSAASSRKASASPPARAKGKAPRPPTTAGKKSRVRRK